MYDEKQNPFGKIIEFWPIWSAIIVSIVSGIVSYVKVTSDVAELKHNEQIWRSGAEERREHVRSDLEDIRTRLTKLETIYELDRAKNH